MHIFIVQNRSANGFQLEERLTPRGTMSVRVNQENLGRESSFTTLEVAR